MSAELDPVEVARRRFEAELDGVKRTLESDWGWTPRGTRWILPVTAIAAGFLAGGAAKRAVRRLVSGT